MSDIKIKLYPDGGDWCSEDSADLLRYHAKEAGRAPWSWARLPGLAVEPPGRFWSRRRDCECYPDECDHEQTTHLYTGDDYDAVLWAKCERRPEPAHGGKR